MRRVGSAYLAILVVCGILGACSSDDSNQPARADGSAGAGGTSAGGHSGAGGSTGGVNGGGTGGTNRGCDRFGFVASGTSCASTGCSAFACSCAGAFPKSITTCSPDGCLIGADCAAVCAEDLGAALACTGSYTVQAAGTGGAGAGGSGNGGTTGRFDAAVPACSPTDVHVAAASASVLGSLLTKAKVLSDETSSLYVAASVPSSSALDLDGGSLPAGGGLVLMKLDATHQRVWSRRFGGAFGLEQVTAFSFAGNGDLLLAGITGMQTDLGGGPEPAATVPQVFVARYDRSGTFVRGSVAPATNIIPVPVGVVEEPSGDILVLGNFSVPWTLGATTLTPAGTSGDSDMFVLRYSSGGQLLDARRYGRNRNDEIFDAVGGPDGSVYLTGFSYHAIDFGKNPIELGTNATSWVVRLDASLAPVWQKIVGGGSGCYPRRAVIDGTTLIVAGDSSGRVSYGDYGDAGSTVLPQANVFAFRIDAGTGALVRGDTYEHDGFGARVTALGLFAASGIAIGGYIQPPVDFGGGTLSTSVKSYQPFVARYDGNGRHVWSTLFCATKLAGGADGAVAGIASDADSAVVLMPFDTDLELGSKNITGTYGTVLVDMPPP